MYRSRPLIRLRAHIEALLAEAKADLSRLHFEHQCHLADLHRQLDEVRSELEGLRTAVRRRVAAERELANLRMLQDVERDFGAKLQ